jgi:hypothetical protein
VIKAYTDSGPAPISTLLVAVGSILDIRDTSCAPSVVVPR